MGSLSVHITQPGKSDFHLFEEFPNSIYQKKYPSDKIDEKHLDSCIYILKDQEVVGRLAIYRNSQLRYLGEGTLAFGNYECVDDLEVSRLMLNHVCEQAHIRNINQVIGPINGSTWNDYRFLDKEFSPRFIFEPVQKNYYPNQLVDVGFQTIQKYASSLDTALKYDPNRLERFDQLMRQHQLIVRNIRLSDFEHELRSIGVFCNEAFSQNFLFTPIEINDFVTKYMGIKNLLSEDLMLLVEDEKGKIMAILFAFIEPQNPQWIVLKSLAKSHECPIQGMTAYLIDYLYRKVEQTNIKGCLHAYMMEGVSSYNSSVRRYKSEVIHRYSLYSKSIV